jgi:hypothetical protein
MVGIINDASQLPGPVLWPDTDTSDSITDLAPPLRLLLINVGLSPTPADAKDSATAGNDVPQSVAIIEAGATQISKASANQVKALGGLTGIAGAVAAFWEKNHDIRIIVVAAAAFVLAAALIAIAVIVSSDVRARANAAAAQYDARARVAEAYLQGAVSSFIHPPAAAVNGQAAVKAAAKALPPGVDARTLAILLGANRDGGIQVALNGDDQHHVANRVRLDTDGTVHVHCGAEGWRTLDEIGSYEPA